MGGVGDEPAVDVVCVLCLSVGIVGRSVGRRRGLLVLLSCHGVCGLK